MEYSSDLWNVAVSNRESSRAHALIDALTVHEITLREFVDAAVALCPETLQVAAAILGSEDDEPSLPARKLCMQIAARNRVWN